jgi:aerotolerance regulator-like protein
MTFGAMAAWQGWVLLAGVLALAIFLFRLKVRPRKVRVPSLLFWSRVLNDSRELTLWERIRRAVSLVLTAAIAIALALALLRPVPSKVEGPSRAVGAPGTADRTVIVLDSSWSMLARTQGGGTRWSRAIAEARGLTAASSGEVALATTADGLVEGPTADRALIESALDRIAPTGTGSAAWPAVAGADAVYFITDGAMARPRDPGVLVRSVFESAPNVAITAFEIRPALGGPGAGEAYLEVANFGPAQQVHVTLGRATAAVLDKRFDMAAGETLRQVVRLDRGGDPAVRARVDARGNALAIDDEAVAWFERARPLSITVVGEQTDWLARLFAGNPEVAARFVTPAAYRPAQEDAIVFDRWAPPEPPPLPALYFEPPPQGAWLAGGDAVEDRPRWMDAGAHPVVRGVDPFTLDIERARSYKSSLLSPIASSVRGTPLISVNASTVGPRFVVVAFGPLDSNLKSAPALPVLAGNALAWLAGTPELAARRPGLASFSDGVTRVTDPGGAAVPLTRLPGELVGVLRAPGLYVVDEGRTRSTFAVNVTDPEVSNLMKSGADATSAPAGGGGGPRPWWLYCAAGAFAAILLEWWTWLRRITV